MIELETMGRETQAVVLYVLKGCEIMAHISNTVTAAATTAVGSKRNKKKRKEDCKVKSGLQSYIFFKLVFCISVLVTM